MTAVFISGILQSLFAVTRISHFFMVIVPLSIKLSIVVGMGILVSMIGMVSVGLVVGNDKTLVGLGDLTDDRLQLAMFGVVLIGSLVYHDVKGGILVGITTLTLISWYMEGGVPSHFLGERVGPGSGELVCEG